jgi:hypothetical protein
MTQQATTQMFHILWDNPAKRGILLTTFLRWVYEGASRLDVERNLRTMLSEDRPDMPMPGEKMHYVKWNRLTEFLCDCWYAFRSGHLLPDPPDDAVWDVEPTTTEPEIFPLHPQRERPIAWTVPLPVLPLEQKLLSLDGKRMVYVGEPDLASLLTRGEVLEGPVTRVRGRPSRCHANVAERWVTNKNALAIATVYSLGKDGLWRRHSWLLRTHPTPRQRPVLETTVPRLRYFGFVLTRDEAEIFVQVNV